MIKVYELTPLYTICDYIDGKETKPIFEIDETKGIHEVIEKNGSFYSVCCISREENKMAVDRLEKFDTDAEETDESDWTCPYCGYVNDDAFELDDEVENYKCPRCGSTVNSTRIISWTYNVEPVKANDVTKHD